MENWQRHGALPTGATLVRAQLSATAWSQKKHSRTQRKVQEAEVHLDYKTLDGTVHTVPKNRRWSNQGCVWINFQDFGFEDGVGTTGLRSSFDAV